MEKHALIIPGVILIPALFAFRFSCRRGILVLAFLCPWATPGIWKTTRGLMMLQAEEKARGAAEAGNTL